MGYREPLMTAPGILEVHAIPGQAMEKPGCCLGHPRSHGRASCPSNFVRSYQPSCLTTFFQIIPVWLVVSTSQYPSVLVLDYVQCNVPIPQEGVQLLRPEAPGSEEGQA